ncbi:MPN527 family putative ECF transporter permease subunit [Mycoplasma sp. 2634B]|uniref:MPN527 family putative ECF transporter permease subunit n=1 Tax=Mycoplasma sp. 2634B TaxID=3401692 RepID=UPI003AAA3214
MTDNLNQNTELTNQKWDRFYWKTHLRPTYKIAFTGIMLALAIVFSILSGFLKFNAFLSFNFSLIPAFLVFTYMGLNYALLLIVSRFLIMPFISTAISLNAGLAVEYLGNFIVFVSQLFFLVFFYLLYRGFSKLQINSLLLKILFSMIFSALAVSIIMPLLNTFLFNLIYFKILGLINSISLQEIVTRYPTSFKGFFFGIPNYYAGSFTLYFIFNLANILINCIIIYIFITWEYKTNFINKISHKNIY